MSTFVHPSSIVRQIWGRTDITLFIFSGAAAEFALNKQVDWLFFTGKLPADPIGRLFSTVQYAQRIIFSEQTQATSAVDKINSIHGSVESSRGRNIPMHAYRDVLYLLIFYSIAAFELLERPLSAAEKDEVVLVFHKMGAQMHLQQIAFTHADWHKQYRQMLHDHLERSTHTDRLFKQYRVHLGLFRYSLLREIQRMLVSQSVNDRLLLGKPRWGKWLLRAYRPVRGTVIQKWLLLLLIPRKFSAPLSRLHQQERRLSPEYAS